MAWAGVFSFRSKSNLPNLPWASQHGLSIWDRVEHMQSRIREHRRKNKKNKGILNLDIPQELQPCPYFVYKKRSFMSLGRVEEALYDKRSFFPKNMIASAVCMIPSL